VLVARPISKKEVCEEVAISANGVQLDPAQRKISYPPRPGPPLSVAADQVREIAEPPIPVAAKPEGIEGGALSILTVVVAVEVPFAFVAVRVYVVVEVGLTVVDPVRVEVEKAPGVIATELAFEMFQERIEEEPESISTGDAVNEDTIGS
jgi:hypothetical protein